MLDQTHPVSVFLAQLCLHLLLLSYCLGNVSEGIRDEGWGEDGNEGEGNWRKQERERRGDVIRVKQ